MNQKTHDPCPDSQDTIARHHASHTQPRNIYRMDKSIDPGNPATTNVGRGDIVLYDSAFSLKHNLAHIIAHELSHQLYTGSSDSDRRDYESKMLC